MDDTHPEESTPESNTDDSVVGGSLAVSSLAVSSLAGGSVADSVGTAASATDGAAQLADLDPADAVGPAERLAASLEAELESIGTTGDALDEGVDDSTSTGPTSKGPIESGPTDDGATS